MLNKPADTGRLSSLDGLRGLAALGVVLIHGDEIFNQRWVPYNAYLAVDFFFLLSGYVLARSFDRRLRQGWALEFLRRRFVRLYPLIIAGSVLGFMMLCFRSFIGHSIAMPQALADVASSLLLIPTPPIFAAKWDIYPTDSPFWSLFYEAAVNVVYALIAPFLTSRRLAVLIGVSAAALGTAIVIFGNADFALDHFEFGGLRVMFSFFLGVGMFRLLEGRKPSFRLPASATVLTFAILAIVLFSPNPSNAPFALAEIFVVFPLILFLALKTDPVGPRTQALFILMGLLSYPLYATHNPIFRLISGIAFHTAPAHVRLAGLVFSMAFAIAAAWVLARFYDEPVRNRLMSLTARSPKPIVASSTIPG